MLTTKQRRVARAVYEGQLTEEQLCREFGITLKLLRRWLVSEELQRELACDVYIQRIKERYL